MATGRPLRNKFERQRTKFWAVLVYKQAMAKNKPIPDVLGTDGRWKDVWARYWRGTVAPSAGRLARIEEKLPGTRINYDAPIWSLWMRDEWSWGNLLRARFDLPPAFRDAFDKEDDLRAKSLESSRRSSVLQDGQEIIPSWHSPYFFSDLLSFSRESIYIEEYELAALSAILMMLYESRLSKDTVSYFCLSVLWAQIEQIRHHRPTLRLLPRAIFERPLTWHATHRVWTERLAPLEIESNRAKNRVRSSRKFDALDFLQKYYVPNISYLLAVYLRNEDPPISSGSNLELWPMSLPPNGT